MTEIEPQETEGTLSGEEIRTIAGRQKMLCVCLLAYIVAFTLLLVFPGELTTVFRLIVLAASVAAMVSVFLLAIKLHGTGMGIVLGILTLIPLLGVIPLLIVNGTATRILRKHGIKVGLMGAKGDM